MTTVLRVPVARATFRVEPRTVAICLALIAATAVVFLVSLSVGVAAYRDGESVDELLNRADQGLYKAKSGGRNQSQVA